MSKVTSIKSTGYGVNASIRYSYDEVMGKEPIAYTDEKDALIGEIRKYYHPGACAVRFRNFVRYTGALEHGGFREQEWNYETMLKSNFSDLKLCLSLLQKNYTYKLQPKSDRQGLSFPEWLSKMTDEMVYNKLAGLTKTYKCLECYLEQTLHDGKQPLYGGSKCDYCGTELIETI